MKNFFKRLFKSIALDLGLVLVVVAGIGIYILVAPEQALADSYTPLAHIPGLTDNGAADDLGTYISNLYNFSIALGAVLAVIMLVIAGFQYASTDNFGKKSDGKKRMTGALLGLGLLLTSYLLLATINSELISTDISIENAGTTATIDGISFRANFGNEQTYQTASDYSKEQVNEEKRLETEIESTESQGFVLEKEKYYCSRPVRRILTESPSEKLIARTEKAHGDALTSCKQHKGAQKTNEDTMFGECTLGEFSFDQNRFCYAKYSKE